MVLTNEINYKQGLDNELTSPLGHRRSGWHLKKQKAAHTAIEGSRPRLYGGIYTHNINPVTDSLPRSTPYRKSTMLHFAGAHGTITSPDTYQAPMCSIPPMIHKGSSTGKPPRSRGARPLPNLRWKLPSSPKRRCMNGQFQSVFPSALVCSK